MRSSGSCLLCAMRILGVVVVVAMGCVPEPTQPTLRCPRFLSSGGSTPPPRTAMLGAVTSQVLRFRCAPEGAAVTGVTLRVDDASGESQPFTASPLEIVDGMISTTVEFEPTTSGEWELIASLDEDRGGIRTPVLVMRDRSEEAPIHTFTTPDSCFKLESAGGLVGCANNDRLRIFRDGGLLAEDTTSEMKAGGEVLWSWNPSGVSRWQGFARTLMVTALNPRTIGVSADEERLVLFDRGELWEFVVAGAGVLERRPLLLDGGIEPDTKHLLAVDGGWVWVRARRGAELDDHTCFRGLDTPTQCAPAAPFAEIIGSEGDGFWEQGPRLGFVRFAAGPERVSAVYMNPPVEVYSSPPRLSFDSPVTVRAPSLELEWWPRFQVAHVTPTHFFGIRGRQVFVFSR